MDGNDLKKILAGMSIAGLLTASAVTLAGCDGAGKESSSPGDNKSAGRTEQAPAELPASNAASSITNTETGEAYDRPTPKEQPRGKVPGGS